MGRGYGTVQVTGGATVTWYHPRDSPVSHSSSDGRTVPLRCLESPCAGPVPDLGVLPVGGPSGLLYLDLLTKNRVSLGHVPPLDVRTLLRTQRTTVTTPLQDLLGTNTLVVSYTRLRNPLQSSSTGVRPYVCPTTPTGLGGPVPIQGRCVSWRDSTTTRHGQSPGRLDKSRVVSGPVTSLNHSRPRP